MNKAVSITKRVNTPEGKRYCPAVTSANGRIKPDYVLIDGKEKKHPEGAYYLDWHEGTKRVRISVGKDAATAMVKKHQQEAALQNGTPNLQAVVAAEQGKKRLDVAATEYKAEVNRSAKKPRTKSAYCKSVDFFLESCTKTYLQDVDRTDLVEFHSFCRDDMEMNPRSCWNRFTNVLFFFKAQGMPKLAKQEDWPVFVEEEVEIYEEWELRALFTSCPPAHRLLFRFFLMSGFREQEVMYLTWKDVNFTASTVRVRHKPQYGWTPKAYKEREVPVPAVLLHELELAKSKATSALVFPAPGGKPEGHMLRILKEVAVLAGLDPAECYLHKFRATFATGCLQALFDTGRGGNAADLSTVQAWLGHKDLASTMRYLRPARGAGVLQKVDALWSSINAPVIEANRLPAGNSSQPLLP